MNGLDLMKGRRLGPIAKSAKHRIAINHLFQLGSWYGCIYCFTYSRQNCRKWDTTLANPLTLACNPMNTNGPDVATIYNTALQYGTMATLEVMPDSLCCAFAPLTLLRNKRK